jgi:peroxiredoxin Q/BCP
VANSVYGKKYMGTERATFVIAPDGKIEAVLRKIAHSAQMVAPLESL